MPNLRIVCKDGKSDSVQVLDRAGNNLCKGSISKIDIRLRPNDLCRAIITYDNVFLDLLSNVKKSNESTREYSKYYPTVKEYGI